MAVLKVSVHDFEKNEASASDTFNILAGQFSVCGPSKLYLS